MNLRSIKNNIVSSSIVLSVVLIMLGIFSLITAPLILGFKVIIETGFEFFTTAPAAPGEESPGGIYYTLIGSVLAILLAVAIAFPIGFLTGVYISEYPGSKLSTLAESASHFLSEVPSIILGIFIYATFVLATKRTSLAAGALSLSLAILPYIVVQVRESLRVIPFTYREAAYSLGLPRWKTIFFVLIPMNMRGILVGLLSAFLRAFSETAPVLFTAGAAFYGFYGLDGPSSTLPLLVWNFAKTPYENWQKLAWGASSILALVSISLSLIIRKATKEVRF